MIKYLLLKTLFISIVASISTNVIAIESVINHDPHRTQAGFFDIHICNWPDRPPFYLTLFGTEEYDDISSIEVFSPDNTRIGKLDLSKFTVSNNKDKPERHVFLTQLPIPKNKKDGWHSAKIHFKNKPSQLAKDFIIHQTMSRASNHLPANDSEDIQNPKALSWDKITGATLYKVFIKDMWAGGKVIHTSTLINTNTYSPPNGILKPGGYYAWRVHARDLNEHIQLGDFNAGSLSSWIEFSVEE